MSSRKLLVMLLAMVFVIGAIGSAHAATGSELITQYNCLMCHDPIPTVSSNAGEVTLITNSINGGVMNGITSLKTLTAADIQAIADYLVPPSPVTCTGYTYSEWSACGTDGQQTRTVTGNTPSGCAGTPSATPVLTQACTPAPVACTGYTYSEWSACGTDGQQTRTVTGNTPSGCAGTPSATPVLTQACTPSSSSTCKGHKYSAWSDCIDGQRTRTVIANIPSGCTGTPLTSAVLTRSCNPRPSLTCNGYKYSAWSACGTDGQQTRTVTGNTPRGCTGTPSTPAVLTRSCNPPSSLTCKGYKYSEWSACGTDGQQTRTVTGNTPSGCTGTPSTSAVLTRSCNPPSSLTNGTTLYMQHCSACHGSLERSQVRGESASDIREAITEVSKMNFLSFLTDAQIEAIAVALETTTPPPPPPVPSGGVHPNGWGNQHPHFVDRNGTSSCTACHGPDLQGGTGPSCFSCHSEVDGDDDKK